MRNKKTEKSREDPTVRRELREILLEQLEEYGEITDEEVRERIDSILLEGKYARQLTLREKEQLGRELFYSVRRLDILQELLDDAEVTEIMVNGYRHIYYEKAGQIHRWNGGFSSEERLEDVVQLICGQCNRIVNEQRPIADARLADGSRVNVVLRPVALEGPILTIRRFPEVPITMEDLIQKESLTEEAADFLGDLVESRHSILVGGGTSTGKTTFLNALSGCIPSDERLITIEDTAELQIQGVDNLVRMETRNANLEGTKEITIRDLIRRHCVCGRIG
ncbi:MAG: ATPase, T2SS/T4P/T4SS family [Eubacteriales bacterium]|nr:ATPase, T2SS/T4P/T4SS family [Eubacteriales bacterium]